MCRPTMSLLAFIHRYVDHGHAIDLTILTAKSRSDAVIRVSRIIPYQPPTNRERSKRENSVTLEHSVGSRDLSSVETCFRHAPTQKAETGFRRRRGPTQGAQITLVVGGLPRPAGGRPRRGTEAESGTRSGLASLFRGRYLLPKGIRQALQVSCHSPRPLVIESTSLQTTGGGGDGCEYECYDSS